MPTRQNVSDVYEVRVNGTPVLTITSGVATVASLVSDGAASSASLTVTGAVVSLAALPTSDPAIAGQLWVDGAANNVVKVSAGP